MPDKIIEVLAKMRVVFNASIRSLESYMRISQNILGISIISYTSIFRKIRNNLYNELMHTNRLVDGIIRGIH